MSTTCPHGVHPAGCPGGRQRPRTLVQDALRLTAPSVGLRFAARARRGAGNRACSDRLVYAPFDHVVPGVAPTVQRMPTGAGARACGAEHDPDSGVDCVQIATTVHDTVNSWQPGRGWRALTVPSTHSASGALPSFPSFNMSSSPRSRPSEAMSGLARRARGRGQACPARKGPGDAPRPLDYVPASQTLSRQ